MLTSGALLGVAAVLAAGLGLLIGSFLNVVVARVPAGASVVRPGSACPACGAPIGPRDNVPVLSWLLLRGRARCCGAPISRRYPVVEAVTAGAFAAVLAWQGVTWLTPALLYLAAISIALAVIDVDHHRLPNAIVLPSYPVAGALLALPAVANGTYGPMLRAALAGFALYAFFAVLWIVYPAGMGFGDVKLAGVLGMYLGWWGWSEVVVGAFLSFVLGGVVGLALLLTRRGTRKSEIPFGPYMLAGTWIGLAVGGPVGDWYLAASGF